LNCPTEYCRHEQFTTPAIGSQIGENRAAVWFSHWFVCPEFYEYWYRPNPDGPVTWHRLYDRITLDYDDGRHYVFILKDEFDCHGRQLGVWPD